MPEMIRYPLPSIAPEDAIPPVPYGGEPPLWHVIDEAIAAAEDDDYCDFWLLRAFGNAMLLTGMLALVGLVAWLAVRGG